ncbi:MAG: hypothetical protein SFT68_05315 [Rickettsiaceae bacterium]|nr:hypothetical protein [Rickettsiaceae bacterium]
MNTIGNSAEELDGGWEIPNFNQPNIEDLANYLGIKENATDTVYKKIEPCLLTKDSIIIDSQSNTNLTVTIYNILAKFCSFLVEIFSIDGDLEDFYNYISHS